MVILQPLEAYACTQSAKYPVTTTPAVPAPANTMPRPPTIDLSLHSTSTTTESNQPPEPLQPHQSTLPYRFRRPPHQLPGVGSENRSEIVAFFLAQVAAVRDPQTQMLTEGEHAEQTENEQESHFDDTGLKEIGNLASWTVSSWKPGSGAEALRNDDPGLYWQYVLVSFHIYPISFEFG